VLRVEGKTAVMTTPRNFDVPAFRMLGVLYGHQRQGCQQPGLHAVEHQLGRMQDEAKGIVLAQPGIEQVRWELDKRWLRRKGIEVPERWRQPLGVSPASFCTTRLPTMSPSTLTAVRTVSSRRSMGNRMAMASVGKADRVRAPAPSTACRRWGCPGADGAEHGDEEDHRLLRDIEFDAGQAGDEEGGSSLVERRAVHVHGGAERHDEAGDILLDVQVLLGAAQRDGQGCRAGAGRRR
jgi:hypothetical protein